MNIKKTMQKSTSQEMDKTKKKKKRRRSSQGQMSISFKENEKAALRTAWRLISRNMHCCAYELYMDTYMTHEYLIDFFHTLDGKLELRMLTSYPLEILLGYEQIIEEGLEDVFTLHSVLMDVIDQHIKYSMPLEYIRVMIDKAHDLILRKLQRVMSPTLEYAMHKLSALIDLALSESKK